MDLSIVDNARPIIAIIVCKLIEKDINNDYIIEF